MDTSETYIKMCKAAVGKSHTFKWGDFGVSPEGELRVFTEYEDFSWWDTATPLLRQDQLQAMMGEDIGESFQHLISFAGGLRDGAVWLRVEHCGGSWEQLWLAFVMKEKYGKTWNGEEWVA